MYKRIVSLFLALFIFSYCPNLLQPLPPLSCGMPARNTYLPVVYAKEAQSMASDSLWWIVVPETTTNLVTNPSIENATTGYSAIGGAVILRSSAYTRRGVYSLAVVPTAALNDGAQYSATLAVNTWYTFSVDIKGIDGVSYRLDMWDTVAGAAIGIPVDFVSDGGWARYAVTGQTGANTAIKLRVYKNSSASGANFFLDGFQVEAKQYATDYCDGDQDGCLWSAGKHTSASSRQAQFSGAGRMVALDDYGYQVGPVVGAGMATVDVTVKRPAIQDGAVFRKQTISERTMQLPGVVNETDLIDYHATRSAILRLLNPNRFATQQPVHLRYTGSGKTLDGAFYYRAGFEATCAGCPNETIPLQMYATDPYWREVTRTFTATDIAAGIGSGMDGTSGSAGENGGGGGDAALAATGYKTLAGTNYIIQKDSTGNYTIMDAGLTAIADANVILDGQVLDMVFAKDGSIFVGGWFHNAGVVAAAHIARWTGGEWSALGAGTDDIVSALAITPDGTTLFVGGSFHNAGGGAAAHIAKYDIATGVWSALGAGADDAVLELAITPDGTTLFVGGAFHNAGGGAAAHIAKLTIATSTWAAIGAGVDNTVYTMAVSSDSTMLYVGGDFHNAGGGAATHVAKLTIATSTWAAIGAGIAGNAPLSLVLSSDDAILYAGGSFTIALGAPGDRVAKCVLASSTWSAVGTGTDSVVRSLALLDDEILYLGGDFHNAGGNAASHVVQYNITAGTWTTMGAGVDAEVYRLFPTSNGMVYISGTFTNYVTTWNGVAYITGFKKFSRAIIQAQDGKIYVGGGFADADSVANTDKITYWDTNLGTWNALGTGADDGIVYALAELANGDIVAAGYFTGMGGVANTQGIAVWDISAGAWTSIGDINGTVFAAAIAPNGDLYIGGLFLDANSVANTQNLAYYDISAATWAAVSAEPDGAVNTLKFDASGKLYIGGAFRHIGATDYDYIALYDPTADTFAALENGTDGYVNSIDIAPNGCVYMTGTFTTAGTVTGVNYVVGWNGTQFQPLSTGLNNQGYVIKTDSAGLVYIGGAFTEAGGVTLPDKVTVWNGTNFKPIDVDLPGTAAVEAILFAPTITVIGFDTAGSAVAAYVN